MKRLDNLHAGEFAGLLQTWRTRLGLPPFTAAQLAAELRGHEKRLATFLHEQEIELRAERLRATLKP